MLMSKIRNIPFLSHSENNFHSKHLSESTLHLNNLGIKVFAEIFFQLNCFQQRKTNLNTSTSLVSDLITKVMTV